MGKQATESLKQGPVMSVVQPETVKVVDHSIQSTKSIFGNKKRRGLHDLTYVLTQKDLGQLHFGFVKQELSKLNTTS